MASDGRFREAIEVLTRANRGRNDQAIEHRLIALRSAACTTIEGTRARASWPPPVDDLFPAVVGPPEVTPEELTLETLRSGILRHGSLLVRGLVGRKAVRRLVKDIDRAFRAHDSYWTGAREPSPWFAPFEPGPRYPAGFEHRKWIREGGGVLAVDSPRTLFDAIEVFEEAGIGRLISSYLGERPWLLAGKWTLRKMSPAEHRETGRDPDDPPDWHQDGAFLGADIRSVDVWLSLSHCGRDAPGLDIVARRLDEIVQTGTDGARFGWSVGNEMAERVARGAIVRPVFEPGDALLFDHLMLHRTGLDRHMSRVRYA
ncbi:MAG: hypothetical protein WEA81_07645, partial [Dehalococcoidia bacterium]